MNGTLSRRAALLGLLALAACRKSGARCETCAMRIDPKNVFLVELEPASGARIVYDTPRCAFTGLLRHPGATMWLREYYEQTERRGSELRFVEHSDVLGPMGPDLIPVDPAKVTQFVTSHGGGRISSYEETLARFAKGQAEVILPRSASASWPEDPLAADIAELQRLLRDRRVCVLTGAGLSTDSGIPDYRSPNRPPRKRPPIQHREFVQSAEMRQRYWARSALGWPRFRAFEPNAGHAALARWEQSGALTPLLTQNVDRLHHKAGHQNVLELHGALERITCLTCGGRSARDDLQARFEIDNAALLGAKYTVLPDGDADLPDDAVLDFVVPGCGRCQGILMPDVVFFGGNVPKPRVEAAFASLDSADVLLVIGSSLTVFSGYRFVLRAVAAGKPVAIVNRGPTRGDAHASVRVDASASQVLVAVAPG